MNNDPLRTTPQDPIRRALTVLPSLVLLLIGGLTLLAGIVWGAESISHKDSLVLWAIAVPMTIAGSMSLIAAMGRPRASERASYVVLLSMIGQLLAMSEIPWFAAFSVVILQSAILISMAVRFRFRPDLRVILVASALAGCSYLVYQRIGPAIGVYGTECGEPPDHLCYGPVLAAGFPLQYFVDVPTISVPGSLGHEDEFRGVSLLLDILIYCAIIIVGQRLARILRIRPRDRRDREGSLEQHAGGG